MIAGSEQATLERDRLKAKSAIGKRWRVCEKHQVVMLDNDRCDHCPMKRLTVHENPIVAFIYYLVGAGQWVGDMAEMADMLLLL